MVAVEVERINHDYRRAVPEDYDKMAPCEPEAAIWITPSRKAAQQVVAALADPPDDEPRARKTYTKTTAPQDIRIEEPGMTAIYTFEYVRDTLLDE